MIQNNLSLQQRQAIRTTWGSVRQIEAFRVRTIFVVGRENPNAHVQSIFEEAKEFGDLLIGDFVDHYRNNTLKVRFDGIIGILVHN